MMEYLQLAVLVVLGIGLLAWALCVPTFRVKTVPEPLIRRQIEMMDHLVNVPATVLLLGVAAVILSKVSVVFAVLILLPLVTDLLDGR